LKLAVKTNKCDLQKMFKSRQTEKHLIHLPSIDNFLYLKVSPDADVDGSKFFDEADILLLIQKFRQSFPIELLSKSEIVSKISDFGNQIQIS
jgi:hypothetical protein